MIVHTVERMRFELEVATAADGRALQAMLSDVRATRIEPVLDRCLSALVPDDRFLRLDTVEVELGAMSMDAIPRELAPRLESALAIAVDLRARVPGQGGPARRSVSLHSERLRQLRRFLEWGILSGSGGTRSMGLDALLGSLIDATPSDLRDALVTGDRRAARCRRLASQFSDASLRRLLRLMLGSRADTVLACLEGLLGIQCQKPLVEATPEAFRVALWRAVLDYVLAHRHAPLDESDLLRSVLRALAAHYGVTPQALAAALLARIAFVSLAGAVRSALARVLVPLAGPPPLHQARAPRTVHDRESARDAIADGPTAGPPDALASLLHLLQQGALPDGDLHRASASSEQWLTSLLRDRPEELIRELEKIAVGPDVVRRLVHNFDWNALSQLVTALEPGCAGFIQTYLLAGERLAGRFPGVRSAHWIAVMGGLLDPHAQAFDTASFVDQASRHSARRLNLSHVDYLDALLDCARTAAVTDERFVPLQEVLTASLDRAERPTRTPETARHIENPPTDPADGEADPAPRAHIADERFGDTAFLAEYFLQYGALPRHARPIETTDLLKRIGVALAARDRDVYAVLETACARPLSRARMAELFPPGLVDRLVDHLIPGVSHRVLAVIRLLDEPLRRRATDVLLATLAAQPGPQSDAGVVIMPVLRQIARAERMPYGHLVARLRDARDPSGGVGADRISRLLSRLVVEAVADTPLDGASPADADPSPARESEAWVFPEKEPCYVGNAGAVLLWPFLPRFFDALGLLDDGRFREPASRRRAAYLLQYLVRGETDGAEYELMLNKILCGLDPGEPLENSVAPSEAEAGLSLELLHGVCQNWPALRNTSADGLRETFLQRDGRLLLEDSAWSLTVSAKPYDMLLDSLPWNLTAIRLSWMQGMLHVAWR